MSAGADKVAGILNQLLQSNIRIETLMKKDSQKGGAKDDAPEGGSGGPSTGSAADLSTSMATLVEAIDKAKGVKEKTGKALKSIITDVGDALSYAAEKMGDKTAYDVISFFELIVDKGGKFLALMLLWGVTGPIAMVGAGLFSLTVVMMATIFQKLFKVNEEVLNGVSTIVNMGKAAAIFGLAMIGYTFVAPMVAEGALYFSLIVTGMTFIFVKAKAVSPEVTDGIDSILGMAKGAALFGVAMILYGLAAPLIAVGALAFAVITLAMTWIFKLAAKSESTSTNGAHVILGMAYNAVLFGLAMIGYALAAPLIATGALVFVLVVGAMMLVFGLLALFLPEAAIAAQTLKTMMWPAIGFMLLFVAVSFFVKEVAIGAVVTILAIGAMIAAFGYAAKKFPEVKIGAKALKTMQWAIPIIMGTFIAVGYFWKEAAIGALVSILGIMGLAVAVSFLGEQPMVELGTKRLKKLAIPFIMFSAGMFILGHGGDWANMLVGVISISIAAVVLGTAAAVLGSPEIALFAEAGALILIQLAGSFLIFAAGMFVLSKSKFTMKDVLVLSALVLALGGAFAAIGLISPAVILGSTAMASLGASLLIAAPGMERFKKVGWKQKDSESLKSAIDGLLNGFGNVGFWTIGKAMLAAGTVEDLSKSLIPMSKGIIAFKKAGFSKRLAEDMKTAVSSLFEAFSVPFSELSLMDYIQISAGIEMVGKMGSAISSMAEGVANMANLTVTEYEIINPGTDKAKIVPKKLRQLTKEDFKLAHDGVMQILGFDPDAKEDITKSKSGIMSALAKFGHMVKYGEGLFSDSPIEYGINYLGKLSKGISSLATGVAEMANMTVTEFEIVNGGTDKAKIVPKKSRQLKTQDFYKANVNTTKILDYLTWPLYKFGKTVADGFGDGYIQDGLNALALLSKTVGGLGKGVADMASASVTTYKLLNPGTDKARLVPDGNIVLSDEHFKKARHNMIKIIDAFKYPLWKFGKTVENGWGDEYVEIGIKALADLTEPVGALADMIVKLGTGQFEVKGLGPKDPKTGIRKMVTTSVISPEKAVDKAAAVLKKILWFIPRQIGNLAKWWEDNGMEEKSEIALSGLDVMSEFMETFVDLNGSYVDALEEYNKTEKFKKGGKAMFWDIQQAVKGIVGISKTGAGSEDTQVLLEGILDSIEIIEDIMDVYTDISKKALEVVKMNLQPGPITLLNTVAEKMNILGTTFSSNAVSGIIDFSDSMSYVKDSLWIYIGMAKALQKAKVDTTRPEDVLFRFSNALIHLGKTFNKKMRKAEINNFKLFNDQIKRLAMMASPFERFERSFGRMAKHMGIFATNFKVMNPAAITAFKDWTDSMVTISKVDISKSEGIVGFINKAVDAAFGGGDAVSKDKKPQDYTESDKRAQVNSQANKKTDSGKTKQKETQQQQPAKIDTAAITNAITAALRNLTVQSITVKGDIVERT
jgi:hypothetical protein